MKHNNLYDLNSYKFSEWRCSSHNHTSAGDCLLYYCKLSTVFLSLNMALPEYGTDTDFYGWLCDLSRLLRKCSNTSLKLHDWPSTIAISAHAMENRQKVSVRLNCDSDIVCELGICRIERCSEEQMQQNLHPLFSSLCIYTFLRVTHKNILGKELGKGNKYIEKSMEVDIAPRSIEASIYKQAFNKLFYAACYFHLHPDRETKLKKLAEETLRIIRPIAAEYLVRALAIEFTQIRLKYKSENINDFKISYSSNLDKVWTVHCFCPRLSMNRVIHYKMDSDLDYVLSYQQLQCRVDFQPEVKLHKSSIDMEIKIINLCCKAFPLDSPESSLCPQIKQQYLPVKVAVTMGPKRDSTAWNAVYRVESGVPSPNPEVNVLPSKTIEGAAQTQSGRSCSSGFNALLSFMGKKSSTKAVARDWKNWHFRPSVVENTQGRFQWTLYHHNGEQEPVFEYHPKSRKSSKFKDFEHLLNTVGQNSPFTEGGVDFGEAMCRLPIKWTFYDDIKGQNLDWVVECDIWMVYYSTKGMEIRHQNFHQVIQLPMEENSL